MVDKITEFCSNISVVGIASNITEGVQLIEQHQPDILFLDIQIGQSSGFELLDKLKHRSFKLIITTAYKDFALKAFQYQAIDYVLKPYSPKNIKAAVSRVLLMNQDAALFDKLKGLIAPNFNSKISFPTSEGIILINVDEIVHVEADRSYCIIYLNNTEKKIVSKSLKDIEAILPNQKFYRLHASHLINLDKLKRYDKEDGGSAVMSNEKHIPIARRRKNEFLELINSYSYKDVG